MIFEKKSASFLDRARLTCAIAFSCALPVLAAETIFSALPDLVRYAKPICGTGTFPAPAGDNNTYPGATVPFGMIQWSPDTEAGLHMGGYHYADKRISDFSVGHISGAGAHYGGDFAMMPILGAAPLAPPAERAAFAAAFSHANETAKPGYYAVTFDNGNRVALTTTTHTGFGRFDFAGDQAATLMINAASDINKSEAAGITLDPAHREITGWSTGGYFGHEQDRERDVRTIYFYAAFDHAFASWSTWSDQTLTPNGREGQGKAAGTFLTFDTSQSRTVRVKIGISYVSIANAKANVQAESPVSAFTDHDFEQAVTNARELWNSWLNRIEISGATQDQMAIFYSMLYHALLGPIVVSDANGEYFGYDGKVHRVESGRVQYGVFSGWDIYRSECQLLAMIAPKEASDMAQALLLDYQQGGAFPRWGVMTQDSGIMIGDPAAPMLAGFYAFGARDFDVKAALAGLVRAATDPAVAAPRTKTRQRDALEDYLKLGYVAQFHEGGGYGPASMTLEYATADFAVSELARALGEQETSAKLLRQAQNWRNLFNPETGFMQMRRRDGSWSPGFVDDRSRYDNQRAFVEGSASQYLWMVPFNFQGLFEIIGGRDAAIQRLDGFFTKLNAGYSKYAYLGNETCGQTPWIYCYLGQPWKTQQIVRRALLELYSSGPAAFPGNDDVGSMSSWYIFSALGMYPETPGSDVLVLGSPLYPKAVVHLKNGDLTVLGDGAGADAPYVESLRVNGRAWEKPWLRFADISTGGTLAYRLSRTPQKDWGAKPDDAPPSFDAP